jgi:hypothetical protein
MTINYALWNIDMLATLSIGVIDDFYYSSSNDVNKAKREIVAHLL